MSERDRRREREREKERERERERERRRIKGTLRESAATRGIPQQQQLFSGLMRTPPSRLWRQRFPVADAGYTWSRGWGLGCLQCIITGKHGLSSG